MLKKILSIKKAIREKQPLIHCLTNEISINDCANVVLAVGAKPIMAQHPSEVAQITKNANALAINLGSITDSKMLSITTSMQMANENNIPTVIDLVGVACSDLRLNFAKELLESKPKVLKGNLSELKALYLNSIITAGTDVDENDSKDKTADTVKLAKKLAKTYNSTILITGKIDVIANSKKIFLLNNGHKMLSNITGTGCMLNCLVATSLSINPKIDSVLLATLTMSIAGEKAAKISRGTGSFRTNLIDEINILSDQDIIKYAKVKEV